MEGSIAGVRLKACSAFPRTSHSLLAPSLVLSMPQASDQNDPHASLGRRQRESAFHLGPRKRAYVMVAAACVPGAD